jgi:DNA-binding transcriptional regulator GbsR (MarR family)
MIKEIDNFVEVMLAIKTSYIPQTSKDILLILLSNNRPLCLSEISRESRYSSCHIWTIMERLIKQKLVKKYKRNISVYTFNLKECNKFLNKEIPIWKRMSYNKVLQFTT